MILRVLATIIAVLLSRCAWGTQCVPCVSASPTLGARGIYKPVACACDWDVSLNLNWDWLNSTTGYVSTPPSAEPLPTCNAAAKGATIFDTTVSPNQACICNASGKWCATVNPNCADGTATTCGVPVGGIIEVGNFAGIDCTGTSDSTAGMATAFAALGSTGQLLRIPSQCVLRFASPGTSNPAMAVPNNLHIFCDDESAGFAVNRQTCKSGQYIGAPCNTDAECTAVGGGNGAGGACSDDFNHAAVNPCNATTCFAPAGGSTYTLMKDAGVGENDVFIENCSFFLAEASPYQACTSAGTHSGRPCRQECDASSSIPGQRCETNADCTGGTCLRTSDCHVDGSATCGGVPSKVPSGPGLIRALDLARTTRVRLVRVSVFDGLTSDNLVNLGPNALVSATNLAREGTDCTSPIPGTPANSVCFGSTATAGTCCYGAAYNPTISSGNAGNTQPAQGITGAGLLVGPNSQVLEFTKARGTTAFRGTGTSVRFDETVVLPFATNIVVTTAVKGGGNTGNGVLGTVTPFLGITAGVYTLRITQAAVNGGTFVVSEPSGIQLLQAGKVGQLYDNQGLSFTLADGAVDFIVGDGFDITVGGTPNLGPGGVSTNGYQCDDHCQVMKSYALNLAGNGTGVNLAGDDSGSVGVKLFLNSAFGTGGTGILMGGNNQHVLGENIKGVSGAGFGVIINGDNSNLEASYIEGTGATAAGVRIGNGVSNIGGWKVNGNTVMSAPMDTLQHGIRLFAVGASGTTINDNALWRAKEANIALLGASQGVKIISNTSVLPSPGQPGGAGPLWTPTVHPIHIYNNGVFLTHLEIIGNFLNGGAKGYYIDRVRTDGLFDTLLTANRFAGMTGQAVTGGLTPSAGIAVVGNYFNNATGTSCDNSCANSGAALTGDMPCISDADCTNCNAGIPFKCIPDAVSDICSAHYKASDNLIGVPGGVSQCTAGALPAGQPCTVAATNGACAGVAPTCTGTPAVCGGNTTEAGKLCCSTPATNGCAVRQPSPIFRYQERGGAVTINDFDISNNKMILGNGNAIGIDLLNTTSGSNLTIGPGKISSNIFDFGGAAATNIGIRFPTTFVAVSGVQVDANNFTNLSEDIKNDKPSMGPMSYAPAAFHVQVDQGPINSVAFVNVTDMAFPIAANRQYFFNCEIAYTSDSLTAGPGFAATMGAVTPTIFDYVTRIPTANVGTAGTDVVQEQEGNGNDATPTAMTAVGSTSIVYTAAVRGNISNGATAGTFQLRVKESTANHITIKAGTTCILTQVP